MLEIERGSFIGISDDDLRMRKKRFSVGQKTEHSPTNDHQRKTNDCSFGGEISFDLAESSSKGCFRFTDGTGGQQKRVVVMMNGQSNDA